MYEVYLCIHMVKVLACCRTGGFIISQFRHLSAVGMLQD